MINKHIKLEWLEDHKSRGKELISRSIEGCNNSFISYIPQDEIERCRDEFIEKLDKNNSFWIPSSHYWYDYAELTKPGLPIAQWCFETNFMADNGVVKYNEYVAYNHFSEDGFDYHWEYGYSIYRINAILDINRQLRFDILGVQWDAKNLFDISEKPDSYNYVLEELPF